MYVVDVKDFEELKKLKTSIQQFPSDLKALENALGWFDQFKPSSVRQKVWLQCQLALAEGFTNAVRHAHKDLPEEVSIDVEVTLLPECLELRIWDKGPPFDLEQQLRDLKQQMNPQSGGGRGIAILQKIADHLSYTRTDNNRNCLLIVKCYQELGNRDLKTFCKENVKESRLPIVRPMD
ncbi:MAG: ATP-binding protein [Moorea sp. SIO1G6]|nr:ATP-binding protein [Moorena sp. SIO3B2]NEP64736.1 ATP-binding protein [Moorena sp. SIO3A5]NEQ08351.1 ATP-binding protein [Moorena sp. SIO4E2]NEQ14561.1 ATP-binding protein [Moorena sp. SIO3E2]NER85767.1 ATP-binding protein [Moorena sp. SIO3A2]NES40762.1 ATP-binding protein [Moorena sp. SIO2C4]NES84162.1 ATP-binding protein [Moorena sp. SIO2B7]NET64487.1 ATP-binding protein [Moorena sp. SIO1G6]